MRRTLHRKEKIRDILRDVGRSAMLALGFPDAGSTDFKLAAASSFDERSESVVSVSGISIVVPNKHMGRVSGIVIDYLETPQQGFSIVRLYAPSKP